MTDAKKPIIGFIGLGEMGGPMAHHLLKASYTLHAFDLDPGRMEATREHGATLAKNIPALVRASDVVLTSLPSCEVFIAVAEKELLPNARAGQVFIETGTTTPAEVRRLAAAFAEHDASLLDVPVSGGGAGARRGSLRLFAGGDPTVFERCRPILEAIGGASKLSYCGPSGAGQAVKGVNQLKSGLGQAARLEAIALAVLSGVETSAIYTAFKAGNTDDSDLLRTIESIQHGLQAQKGVKFRELPYFLAEADKQGFDLPLTRALYNFMANGERVVKDDHRDAPSFWHELTKGRNLPRRR